MMLAWMTYGVVVGALIVVAAIALDRVAGALGWPRRFFWLGAITTALLWPIASTGRALIRPTAALVLPFTYTLPPFHVGAEGTASSFIINWSGVLAIAWLVVSALLLGRLLADVRALRALRVGWPVREVDGRSVRLTREIGPAVIGVRQMELVLPEWILSLDEPLRALVIRHEEEHRAARDPQLLIAVRLATLLMPWNPAIWYAARRLRLAIELDCDARVLRAHPSPQRYGMLLLTLAQRRATLPTALAPSLSEPTTQLERRILAMRSSRRRLASLTAVAGALVAAAALALACSVQSDTAPTAAKSARSTPRAAPQLADNSGYFEFQVERPVAPAPGSQAPRYPDALREAHIEGQVLAQFVVDTSGHVDMRTFEALKSTNDAFTGTVRTALANMNFRPALVGGKKVRQIVQMPFVFSLSKRPSPRAGTPAPRRP
jgi:bla regulator protein blaR1